MEKPTALYLSANALFVDDGLKTKTAPDNIEYLRADLALEFTEWLNEGNLWFWSKRNLRWLPCTMTRSTRDEAYTTSQLFTKYLEAKHPDIAHTFKTE